ncbi:MAG: type I glyceraldehyde-3-phosphate dehydrogenase, partial [Proteobacteria bacterium]|nr:type I glyceraldehyde-3-phosphate dehydrogenase [Pseudomonadota bacterium]
INNLASTAVSTHLLNYDSVHGALSTPCQVNGDMMNYQMAGKDHQVSFSHEQDPKNIPWRNKCVDMVFECSGAFTTRAGASKHLHDDAMSVLISAPAENPDLTVVCGVTDHLLRGHERILSNASCTTGCLAPVCKVILDHFSLSRVTMTTVHAITGDQRILDGPHKDLRRARTSMLSMIPTTTGAAKMVAQVLPQLTGKIDGIAVRVPTANVSLCDVVMQLNQPTTSDQINDVLKTASASSMKNIIKINDIPLVSTDFNGSSSSSIVDTSFTKVIDDTLVKLLLWYDNEMGFSARMLDVAQMWNNARKRG